MSRLYDNLSPEERTKLLLKVMNEIINDPDPTNMIKFTRKMVVGMGRFLVAPAEVIEQLCARLEHDIENFQGVAETEKPNQMAEYHVAVLRIFLKYRQPIIDDIEKATSLRFDQKWPL